VTNPRKSDARILFTTGYRFHRNDYHDVVGDNFVLYPYGGMPQTTSPSLRFLKQNVPGIEILEYPTWLEYVTKLAEGWDVVGFTFLHRHLAEVMQMAAYARQQGIKQIWAGGYGAFAEETKQFADRVFYGYAEEVLYEELTGQKLEQIRHPPVIIPNYLSFGPGKPRFFMKKMGYIFSQRGCTNRCTFCQTPVHTPKPYRVPLESIEEVLRYYRSVGINEVYSFDETFYIFHDHSEAVVDLLAKYKMNWWTATRADKCLDRLKDWAKKGLANIGIGLESVNEENLKKIDKKITLEQVREFRRVATENDIFTASYYMLGYENDTMESIREDLKVVRDFGFDCYLLTILTPFPQTPLWDEIAERYGIFDTDYHHFDAKHLVWNHPNIKPDEMRLLLQEGKAILNNPRGNYGAGVKRMMKKRYHDRGLGGFLWEEAMRPWKTAFYPERKYQILP
jgi:radical SAM superfamily enzyme YgiQ (UPF0313 family)